MVLLDILMDVVKQPALIVGIFSFIGLMALRKPFHKVLTGTLRPILGYIMMMAGANIIVANLEPLGQMIHEGFHITGVVPSNEAIVASASRLLGTETMFILVAGLMMNLVIARLTKFKYVFLTVHHSFFMACLLSAVLGTIGLSGVELVLAGGFLLGGLEFHFPGHWPEIYEPRDPRGPHRPGPLRQSGLLHFRLGRVQGRQGGG